MTWYQGLYGSGHVACHLLGRLGGGASRSLWVPEQLNGLEEAYNTAYSTQGSALRLWEWAPSQEPTLYSGMGS